MSGELNGLKALILKENSSAYYVHCFAHQLQLVIVALANKHRQLYRFFDKVSVLTNVVCASCQRLDMIRKSQEELKEMGHFEVETGRGLNQERSLARAGDTRWSSHYKTLIRLIQLYPSIIKVLDHLEEYGNSNVIQQEAYGISMYMRTFDFVYYLHMMKEILGYTNTLCEALQRKDQDILNAVGLVKSTKQDLQKYRLEGFGSLLENVTSFCQKYDIQIINMDDEYIDLKNRRSKTNITNRHHYEFDNFNTVLDMQIQELGNRFNEVTTELLACVATLNPHNNFCDFDIQKILRLSEMYPNDFNYEDKDKLEYEARYYIVNVKEDTRFANMNGISNLAKKMVETRKHNAYPLVYRLIKLSLILPVATASVERCFSSMKHVKTELRNRMSDEYMNDACITYIEKEFFANVSLEDVIDRFQKMSTRRGQL
ncbi:hypothetical protein SSX86_005791 [Deinandra increscens subsp. villosa]|uniref:HAT C-terminal dimerisation domain-containing protein n=1 Tax=Deinandra increscens subsp. villosa TaxID=3103831 RepID=A0AAP0DUK4_9ASTR